MFPHLLLIEEHTVAWCWPSLHLLLKEEHTVAWCYPPQLLLIGAHSTMMLSSTPPSDRGAYSSITILAIVYKGWKLMDGEKITSKYINVRYCFNLLQPELQLRTFGNVLQGWYESQVIPAVSGNSLLVGCFSNQIKNKKNTPITPCL